MNCNCACHDPDYDDGGEECSEFECPDCGEELDEKGLCVTETCDNFECDPFASYSGMSDEAERKWERQQMGITG